MFGSIQIQRDVPLTDAKILKETKGKLYEMLQKNKIIILKSDNDKGQTDLIQMHMAMKLNAAPIAAPLYPLAPKHHDFLKQELINSLDARIM